MRREAQSNSGAQTMIKGERVRGPFMEGKGLREGQRMGIGQ